MKAAADVIKEGDHVILDEHGDKKSIHIIKKNGRAKVGKYSVPIGQLIGVPWGATYKLAADGSKLVPVEQHESVIGPAVEDVDKDNSTLVDLNAKNQGLKAEDIQAMKASGRDGEEIIAALCSNSTTFEGKTEFAQEKYKKRKARKYMPKLTLLQPTAWAMCEVIFDKAPTGIWNLRPDSLALLLSLANVAAHSRTLVLENCQGLIAGACAERQGGHGVLCCLGTGAKAFNIGALRQMNLAREERSIVCTAQLSELQEAAKRVAAAGQQKLSQRQTIHYADQQPQQQHDQQIQQQSQQMEQQNSPQQAPQHQSQQQQQQQDMQQPNGVHHGSGHGAVTVAAKAAANAPANEDTVMAMYEDVPKIAEAAAGNNAVLQLKAKKQRLAAAVTGAPNGSTSVEQDQQQQKQQQQQQVKVGRQQQQQWQQEEQQEAATGGPVPDKLRLSATQEQLEHLAAQKFSSCIIAAPRLHTISILQEVLPLLAPSTPFVVFSPWVQPLAEAMHHLTCSKQAVMLQLQESWLRPYQVLPGRTHPHMNMTTGGTGGYILSGITVLPPGEKDFGGQAADVQQSDRSCSGSRGRGRRQGKRQKGR